MYFSTMLLYPEILSVTSLINMSFFTPEITVSFGLPLRFFGSQLDSTH